jgi:hypothetical protein
MRHLLAVAAVALAAVPTSSAAVDRGLTAPGTVGALEVTGPEVAYSAAGSCVEVRVWDTADRGNRRYGRHCFPRTSTGSGVAGVAVAGRRALWLSYTGGNLREWSLWTASRTAPRPRLVAAATRDVDDPAPIVLGSAQDGAIPYALDRRVVALRPSGARAFAWDAPERVAAVTAGQQGYVVTLAGGDLVTLNVRGEPVRRHGFAPERPKAAVLGPSVLIVHLEGRLLVRGNAGDRSLPLPRNARFLGVAAGIVAYAAGGELRLLRLSDGADVRFRGLPLHFRAGLDRRGLGYGWNRRVSWVGIAQVTAAFRGT